MFGSEFIDVLGPFVALSSHYTYRFPLCVCKNVAFFYMPDTFPLLSRSAS